MPDDKTIELDMTVPEADDWLAINRKRYPLVEEDEEEKE